MHRRPARRLVLTAAAAVTLAALVTAVVLVLVRPGAVHDPATARCDSPTARSAARPAPKTTTRCPSDSPASAPLAATDPPPGPALTRGRLGNGAGRRLLTYRGIRWSERGSRSRRPLLRQRGAGQSDGTCCPGDSDTSTFSPPTPQAPCMLANRPDIDPTRLGFVGASQAGWVVPLALARAGIPVRFARSPTPRRQPRPRGDVSHLTDEGAQHLPMHAISSATTDRQPEALPSCAP
jgi:hypothetical protein